MQLTLTLSQCRKNLHSIRVCVIIFKRHAPVAQLDRVTDYESGGRRFESSRARHLREKHANALSIGI